MVLILAIYRTVKKRNIWWKNQRKVSCIGQSVKQRKKSFQKEIGLIKTLAVTVIVFVLCWTPYFIAVLCGEGVLPPLLHKVSRTHESVLFWYTSDDIKPPPHTTQHVLWKGQLIKRFFYKLFLVSNETGGVLLVRIKPYMVHWALVLSLFNRFMHLAPWIIQPDNSYIRNKKTWNICAFTT